MPRLLAGGLGLALVTLAVAGRLLGPGTVAESVPGGLGLMLVQGVVGAWLVLGRRLKAAAGLLGLLCLASAVLAGPMLVLESGQVVGIALYLGLTSAPTGSGKRARVIGTSSGARALGLSLGVTLVVVAFTEKLGGPGVAAALLDGYPSLDVLGALGVSEATFIRLAGTAEVLLGLLLITGAAPELVALAAGLPFLATVPVFGVTELVGHLPVYVALLALAVHAVAPEAAPAVARAPTPGAPRPSLFGWSRSTEAHPALHLGRRPSRGGHRAHGAVLALSRERASGSREGRLPLN